MLRGCGYGSGTVVDILHDGTSTMLKVVRPLARPAIDTAYSVRGQGAAAFRGPACGPNNEIAQTANADVAALRIG
jgi:hypothetical protein